MKNFRIRKGDKVMVIAGKDKGVKGKVVSAAPKTGRIAVEGVAMVTKHQKSRQQGQPGGIVEKEMPIHVSNVMVVCSACAQPTRVGYKYIEADGKQKKVRFCKKCNEVME